MNVTDFKYVSILSTRLEQYQQKNINPFRANFRCPICGDSKRSKTKTRGWLLEKNNSVFFHCFNCGMSYSFRNFIRQFDENLFGEYVADIYLERGVRRKTTPDKKKLEKSYDGILDKIPSIASLPTIHPARRYVEDRMIPEDRFEDLFYVKNFNEFVNDIIPKKMNPNIKEPRLLLPMLDGEGQIFGFQGRSFSKDGLRYISIMLKDMPKVFGLDKVDWKRRYIVVEGPIDSLFLENCIAMAGADLRLDALENIENSVFVFDNEPRNKEIVSRMESLISSGHSVCIWPESVREKDINDMVLAGHDAKDIRKMIFEDRTKGKLDGQFKLTKWRKV